MHTFNQNLVSLKSSHVDTPLGSMLAIASDEALYLLEFTDRRNLDREIKNLTKTINPAITTGSNFIISLIEKELKMYFKAELKQFTTPCFLLGSGFRRDVWEKLKQIPYGKTQSYKELAIAVQKPTGFRAVAQANGANQLAIIIPCHRVINSDGKLGGYAAGLARKQWLIDHEMNISQ